MCAGRRVMWCDVLHAHVSVTYTCQHTRTAARGRESRARAAFSRAAFASWRGRGHAAPASRVCVCTAHPSATTRLQCCKRMAAHAAPSPRRRSGVIPPGRRAPADRRARWSAVPCPRRRCGHPAYPAAPGTRHAARAGPPRPPLARHRKSQSSNQAVTMMRGTRDHLRGSGRYRLKKRMTTGTVTKVV